MLDDSRPLLTAAGLTVVGAQRRRFVHPITTTDDAAPWTRSLYLPDLQPGRPRAAQRVRRRWAGSGIGIPLRRPGATKNPPPPPGPSGATDHAEAAP